MQRDIYSTNKQGDVAFIIISAFMTLELGVYEDKKGQVFVSQINVGLLGHFPALTQKFPENVTKVLFFDTKVVDFVIWVAELCMRIWLISY